MSNENFIDITELDFKSIKENFKTYLKSKQKFNGYDFEGSSMNILLDILAYNSHYAAFYASMVGNEMFLDSAAKRDSVVSHAKLLNYVPKSKTSARAKIKMTSIGGTIRRGNFVNGTYTNDNNESITKIFSFLEDYTPTSGTIESADVYEGTIISLTYVYDSRAREKKFLIPSDADTSTIRVKIRQTAAAAELDTEQWYLASDFSQLGPDEKVFFLQGAYDGQYEVYFGDGVLGKSLDNGNIIYIEYLQSSGEDGNFFNTFSGTGTITTLESAIGGSNEEDVTDIRKNAPKAFVAQNRAVTAQDYESLVLSLYPQAETIKAWGGEDNDPPQFGKVFISVKPNGALVVPQTQKEQIITGMKTKSVAGIVPELIDPEYLYASLSVTTTFNPFKTSLSRNEISSLQRQTILDYFDTTLEKFDTPLYLSKLNKSLDSLDSSILGTIIKTTIEQQIRPSTKLVSVISLEFMNPVFHPYDGHKNSIRSSSFGYKNSVGEIKVCYIEDDGYGKLSIVTGTGSEKTAIVDDAGEVNYATGSMILYAFKPENYDTLSHIKVRIIPSTDDIFVSKNKIITTSTENIQVSIVTKDEVEKSIRGGIKDFNETMNIRGVLPDGPVTVSSGSAIRSPSPFVSPALISNPPLPNSVPFTLPTIGRV